jgi:hypothetical protein
MSGKPGPYEGVVDKFSLPEEDLQGARAQELRNRRAAALCLRAAAMTESALDRQHLRRRAAQLISPDQGVGASAWPVDERMAC